MIRYNKPVKILEWGEGTNTTNQVWTVCGEGHFTKRVAKSGVTTLTIETNSPVKKKNEKDTTVKLAQLSEGMAAQSDHWGEVAIGHIKSIAGKTVVVEIPYATKISGAAGPIAGFFGLP